MNLCSPLHIYSLITGSVHSCAISTPRGPYSPATISALGINPTHCHYTLNNIGSLKRTLQYYSHATQENPARVLLGFRGNSIEGLGLLLNNLYCLECTVLSRTHLHLSEVKHLRIKCLTQGHNIVTTISQL